ERAAGRIGTPGTAIEVRADAGPLERVFEKSELLSGAAETDRHFVESNASRRFIECPTGDFDRFSRLPWSGEQTDVAASNPHRRRHQREEVTTQPSEIRFRIGVVVDGL